jgi:transcriptional regulator with PAS, ATPase and Fis domain
MGDDFVAESDSLKEAVAVAEQMAEIASTVLVTGETGTGKEVIAGLIHARSRRCRAAFVKVNCAAVPETLLESELFGHERGAFTGAEFLRLGRFEQADGGTLLLDEIAETSPATQAKLLRVLQDQEFYRLGGSQPRRTDARIIAATNRDLRRAISQGEFREDLYYRLNVIEIHLAPLRERPEDLQALTQRFFARFSRELGQPLEGFSEPALARIMAHDWPGNVRELRNAIERAVLMALGSRIEVADLAIEDGPTLPLGSGTRLDLPVEGFSLSDVEREVVLAAVRRAGFVQKDAADLLGVSRRKLNYMVQRLEITHPSWRRNRGSIPQPDDEKV